MEHSNDIKHAGGSWKKGFLTIAGGQTVSLIGSSAVQFSLIWWLASETSSPLMMSLAGILAFLPQLLLGPFAGVWIDRLSRKTVMICADLFIGLVATVFAIAFFLVEPPYWSACIVLGVRAVGNVFHMPASQAAIGMLVPPDQLVKANSWSQFLMSGAFMLGPVIGAAMYAALPMPIILLSDLAGAVVASITVAVVKIPEINREHAVRAGFLHEIKEGFTVFARDKKLLIVTVFTAVCMVFFMPLNVYYPLMSSSYFKLSAWYASLVEFTFAFGMMLGAAVVGKIVIKNKLRTTHFGLMAIGLFCFFGGILPNSMTGFWLFIAACLLLGASGNLYNVPFIAYMQETVPHESQGRAFSLMNTLFSVTMPVGIAIAGPVAEKFGVPFWFSVSGVAIVIASLLSFMLTQLKKPVKQQS
jgi:DHA3 family macrolide efflux protein-like MFS transporter